MWEKLRHRAAPAGQGSPGLSQLQGSQDVASRSRSACADVAQLWSCERSVSRASGRWSWRSALCSLRGWGAAGRGSCCAALAAAVLGLQEGLAAPDTQPGPGPPRPCPLSSGLFCSQLRAPRPVGCRGISAASPASLGASPGVSQQPI